MWISVVGIISILILVGVYIRKVVKSRVVEKVESGFEDMVAKENCIGVMNKLGWSEYRIVEKEYGEDGCYIKVGDFWGEVTRTDMYNELGIYKNNN